uniref:Phosphoribosyl pyrophosphate synthetase associated protein 2 n=1 Tax=Canis lupus familiaris TaxID=9615 RepID=A0A8I3Q138_CANLF
MFCVAPPELETKMNITKGGLVLFSANSNSSCMELSKKIAESPVGQGDRMFKGPGVCTSDMVWYSLGAWQEGRGCKEWSVRQAEQDSRGLLGLGLGWRVGD